MLTYGLNRPLFSFGLSYPGYFFVIVPPVEGTREAVFKVYESNRFKAAAIARRLLERYTNAYIAVESAAEQFTNYYSLYETPRLYLPADDFYFIVTEVVAMKATEQPRGYTAEDRSHFSVSEKGRGFIAIERQDYAEIYRY